MSIENENSNDNERIDELNKTIRKNMRKSKLCGNLFLTGSVLSMVASSYIVYKVPNAIGYSLTVGGAIFGSTLVGVPIHKKEKRYDREVKDCLNELHQYALEEHKERVKSK